MAKKKIPASYIDEMLAGREPGKGQPGILSGPEKVKRGESGEREQRNIYISKGVWRALRRYALDSGESASKIIRELENYL